VCRRIETRFEGDNLQHSVQNEFCERSLCNIQLLEVISYFQSTTDKGALFDYICIGFSKPFDKISTRLCLRSSNYADLAIELKHGL